MVNTNPDSTHCALRQFLQPDCLLRTDSLTCPQLVKRWKQVRQMVLPTRALFTMLAPTCLDWCHRSVRSSQAETGRLLGCSNQTPCADKLMMAFETLKPHTSLSKQQRSPCG